MNGWVPIFLAFHLVAGVFIVVLVGDYHFVDPALLNDITKSGRTDSLNVANQLGRLDVLTIAITLLSIVIAAATILGFWYYRGVVEQRAVDEVRERLPMLVDEFVKRNPHIMTKAVRDNASIFQGSFAGESGGSDFADDIARAMEGDPEDEDDGSG